MRQEGNHIAFYASEADRHLSAHRGAQRLVRATLARLWKPVGAGVMPKAEVAFMARTLFGGADGRTIIERIDRRIDRLPGLENLGLVTRALQRYERAAGPPADGAVPRAA